MDTEFDAMVQIIARQCNVHTGFVQLILKEINTTAWEKKEDFVQKVGERVSYIKNVVRIFQLKPFYPNETEALAVAIRFGVPFSIAVVILRCEEELTSPMERKFYAVIKSLYKTYKHILP